jgi:uncharacterized protein YceH (UPF0502 family)
VDLTAAEIRVLGCLVEKQRTTPDAYPLTLNALRTACNQATARDPVVRYDDATVRDAMTRLSRRRWARLAGGGRAPKFRHLLDDALTRAPDELAVLCVLMLRGPQTPGELKQRTDRLHAFADLHAIHETLRRLIDRGLVLQLERRPGQKEERYAHRLGEDAEDAPAVAAARYAPPPAPAYRSEAPMSDARPAAPAPAAASRLPAADGALERRVAQLEAALAALTQDAALSQRVEALEAEVSAPDGGQSLQQRVDALEYASAAPGSDDGALGRRLERLEAEVAELRAELRALLDELT